MKNRLRRRQRQQGARQVLRRVFGSHRRTAIIAVIVLMSLALFQAGIGKALEALEELLESAPGLGWVGWAIQLGMFPAVVIFLWLMARRAAPTDRPHIQTYDNPSQVKVLILFLSPPPREPHLVHDILSGDVSGQLSDPSFRRSLEKASWRMPLEAIAYHSDKRGERGRGRLELVIVIGSEDRFPHGQDPSVRGTRHDVDRFKEFVRRVTADDDRTSKFEVLSLHQLVVASQLEARLHQDYDNGVDFENPSQLEWAVHDAYTALSLRGYEDRDVLVDVTGGQKPPSIAGAVVALASDRRIQYVSTHDYRVRVYDVTYDS